MADLTNANRQLIIKRQQHAKLVALSQIGAREIRLMELAEEKARCEEDIAAQQKAIADADLNIKQQEDAIAEEQTVLNQKKAAAPVVPTK